MNSKFFSPFEGSQEQLHSSINVHLADIGLVRDLGVRLEFVEGKSPQHVLASGNYVQIDLVDLSRGVLVGELENALSHQLDQLSLGHVHGREEE